MDEKCQMESVREMGSGPAQMPHLTLEQWVRVLARRHLSIRTKQRVRGLISWFMPNMNYAQHVAAVPSETIHEAKPVSPTGHLEAGDRVRVRSREEIESTLNQWRQVKGCAFMGEMFRYCGTEQRVFKRLRRFVDERDAKVYKASGLVLLENVICQGTADYGPCDRSCFYFWREEWLEKIADPVTGAT